MKLPRTLNPVARRFAARLLKECPNFAAGFEALEDGTFEASVAAPEGSRAGALVCREDEDELVLVVRALLAESAVLAVIREGERWVGTTLIAPGTPPPIEPGQVAEIFSWTGTTAKKAAKKVTKAAARKAPTPTRPATKKTPKAKPGRRR